MNELLDLIVRVRGDVEVTLGFVIAIIITVHVLLTKREVAAAVGWIGLAWFSPFLGGLTYFVFGINRVHRRGRRLRGGPRNPLVGGGEAPRAPEEDDHLAPLRRGVGAIARRPSPPGNTLQTLHNGDEAYPAMLAAIEGAQQSIGLSTYIMRADTTGKRFVAALKAAQDRGVQVRVIVDGIGSGWLVSPAYSLLRGAGIPAGRFMHSPMPWRMPFLNLRSHKKILVVDGTLGFTGGINIADQNVLASKPRNPVQDNHFRIQGPIVGQLVEAFARDWALVSEEELDGPAWFPDLTPAGEDEARVVTAGPDADLEKIESTVLQAISCARDSIRLMTPYFLPDQQLITALSLAAMRGVAVEVVIPQQGDHRLVNWATRANVGPLLHNGVRIWRSPQPFRHSKMLVVDSEWCLIGSSNWDMRSFRLNFELCIEVYSRPLAAELETLMTQCRGRTLEIAELNARSLPLRLTDASARLLLPYL
jgi:cardiolipin synthase